MNRDELYVNIEQSIKRVHEEIFPSLEMNEILPKNDIHLNNALDKYVMYFNFTENTDKYKLNYCFDTTIKDLSDFYTYQEQILNSSTEKGIIQDLEHRINEHIYDEVTWCQKKINRIYIIYMFLSYFLTFLLFFGMNQIAHMLEINTFWGSTLLAMILAIIKVMVDKKYIDKIQDKMGWKAYKNAVKRSLSFYFMSVVLQNHCNHISVVEIEENDLIDLKEKIHTSIDILLSGIIV